MATTKGRSPAKRGFAAMGEEKKREIAAKGGQSVPAEERSFSKDHELASEAGSKGGKAGSHEQHAKAGHESHKNR